MTGRRATLLLILAGVLAGCAAQRGIRHPVEPGQSAHRIAWAYGIETRKLLEANGIPDPRIVRAGMDLWIPGATRRMRVPTHEEFRDRSLRRLRARLPWPVRGPMASGFGGRRKGRHHGIDILAPEGTKVRAPRIGLVLYAGDGMRGYGNVVILDHGEGITTLYGHLKEIRVKSGGAIAKGRVIGTVGRTGNATTHHLHFEVRIDGEAVNPLDVLVRDG
jgi:murein DD-endopeptidase MepM/ murein hydrolase activator NlpD